jgi:hypothetical protein
MGGSSANVETGPVKNKPKDNNIVNATAKRFCEFIKSLHN